MVKHKKHDKIINDFENEKRKHLTKLGNKLIKQKEKQDLLKKKPISSELLTKLF